MSGLNDQEAGSADSAAPHAPPEATAHGVRAWWRGRTTRRAAARERLAAATNGLAEAEGRLLTVLRATAAFRQEQQTSARRTARAAAAGNEPHPDSPRWTPWKIVAASLITVLVFAGAATMGLVAISVQTGFFRAKLPPELQLIDLLLLERPIVLAQFAPLALETSAWLLTLMVVVLVVYRRPYGRWHRAMWYLGCSVAVVNAVHTSEMSTVSIGLSFGAMSILAPTLIHLYVLFMTQLAAGRTVVQALDDTRNGVVEALRVAGRVALAVLRVVVGVVLHPGRSIAWISMWSVPPATYAQQLREQEQRLALELGSRIRRAELASAARARVIGNARPAPSRASVLSSVLIVCGAMLVLEVLVLALWKFYVIGSAYLVVLPVIVAVGAAVIGVMWVRDSAKRRGGRGPGVNVMAVQGVHPNVHDVQPGDPRTVTTLPAPGERPVGGVLTATPERGEDDGQRQGTFAVADVEAFLDVLSDLNVLYDSAKFADEVNGLVQKYPVNGGQADSVDGVQDGDDAVRNNRSDGLTRENGVNGTEGVNGHAVHTDEQVPHTTQRSACASVEAERGAPDRLVDAGIGIGSPRSGEDPLANGPDVQSVHGSPSTKPPRPANAANAVNGQNGVDPSRVERALPLAKDKVIAEYWRRVHNNETVDPQALNLQSLADALEVSRPTVSRIWSKCVAGDYPDPALLATDDSAGAGKQASAVPRTKGSASA